jgi:hypothetical protein
MFMVGFAARVSGCAGAPAATPQPAQLSQGFADMWFCTEAA